MPTLAEGIQQQKNEIADAEARLAAISGDTIEDRRYREWLEDQLERMRASLAAYQAAANPPLGTV
jgi:hypothetical protein